MKDVFVQLREKLDGLGVGFPDLQVAVPYLKKVFTEEHAQVYLAMEEKLQPVEEVAKRLNRGSDEVKPILDEMADKGLVMTTTKIEPTFYAPWPWMTGWGDWTAYIEDKETAELFGRFRMEFGERGLTKGFGHFKRNIFRTIPIYETIPDNDTVASYDDVRKILEQAESISIADCYCDRHRMLRGEEHDEPLERCFLFGMYADYLVEKGFGRKISVQEGIEILDKCRDAGLVQNVTDLANPVFICNCGENCGSNLLRSQVPGPFEDYERTTNYYAAVDTDLCTGCEDCVGRCPVYAISVAQDEAVAEINQEVCIGCGQCVYHCPAEAVSLKKRPESELYTPIPVHPNERSNEEYKADLEKYKDIIKPKT
jgi:NAD-dependent dihydropyrimidine dehydrogenase PreA subunit